MLELVGNTSGWVVARCSGCAGVWLDDLACRGLMGGGFAGTLKSLLGSERLSVRPAARTAFREAWHVETESRRCPICQEPLGRRYLRDADAYIDACPHHGTFFGADEIMRVIQSLEIQVAAGPMHTRSFPGADFHPSPRPGGRILRVGAVLFALSMALPAVHERGLLGGEVPGYLCALFGLALIRDMPLIGLGALANIWLVISPLFLRRCTRLGLTIAATVALVSGVIALSISFTEGSGDLRIGYLLWMASFFVISAGLFVRGLSLR